MNNIIDLKKKVEAKEATAANVATSHRLSKDPVDRAFAPVIALMEAAGNSYSALVLEDSSTGWFVFRADLARQFKEKVQNLLGSFIEVIDDDIASGGAVDGLKPDIYEGDV